MKKIITLTVLVFTLFNGFSQVTFQKGYIITDSNETIECYIKNVDFFNIPKEFIYKKSLDGEEQIGNVKNIKEFGLSDELKYISAEVNIDKTVYNIDDLDTSRNVKFEKDTLFLKVLVEGDANLYYYENNNLIRFFYKIPSRSIEQLVHKIYNSTVDDVEMLAHNYEYKQQLLLNLKCSKISLAKVENLQYNKSLINFFDDYNKCKNPRYVKSKKAGAFNFTPKIGIKKNTLKFKGQTLDADLSYKLGAELEFIFPFNKGKWSLLFEPLVQSFKAEKDIKELIGGYENLVTYHKAEVDYSSVEFSFGVRHYMQLNEKSKLFLNYLYVFDIVGDSNLKFKNITYDFEHVVHSVLGIGYKYKNKFSAEVRYGVASNLLWKKGQNTLDYSNFSFLLGYTIF
ncbi:hypothetical protein [Lutibacter citreus]|uniref:hypothetical protein n=1 Tax=Lutibacter citreus TaxID=2138210 RepID=UPI000DBE6CB8|nr:hypothetical protein [Lutibacter citreus]